MNRAFIFDMDGVLVDSERAWLGYDDALLSELFGKEIAEKIGNVIGMSVKVVYAKGVEYGATIDYETYVSKYDSAATRVYNRAELTPDAERLVEFLKKHGFRLGLVSSSRRKWIEQVLPRLSFKAHLEQIVSLNDREDLRPKPAPDGYIEVLQKLNADPEKSIVLEDSNTGIQAAKASRAYVIGFRGNLVPGYEQDGADTYAETMQGVMGVVEKFIQQ